MPVAECSSAVSRGRPGLTIHSRPMKNILFVDDEPQLLESLKSLLRKQRKEWRMSFVQGGEAAMQELLAVEYDVIISDMRMPGMDGAALLTHVMNDYPHIVRIVLSGQTEQDVSRRMVHVAHQFMSKPCDGRDLQQTIQRACSLQALLEHPALRQAVGQIGQLPVKPATYAKLVEVLANPNSSIADAAGIIESDIGTSSKILQVVNSAFFGLSQRVGDIKTAVSYLGLEMVKTLALSEELRCQTNVKQIAGLSIEAIQEHGLLSARIAKRLLTDKMKAQDAFAAAILQDTGLLVLMSRLPDKFREIVEAARATGRPLHELEAEILGVTHAEIGAYLLGIWGLPYSIVEAVAHHHHPMRSGATTWDVVSAVHTASALASELAPPGDRVDAGVALDAGFVAAVGATSNIPIWRSMAKQERGS
jgi:HD-like signal output (HDOD) protein/CheY-like chemotaxis protein